MIRIVKFKFLILKKKYREINKNCNFRIARIYRFIFPKISLFYKMETRVECGKTLRIMILYILKLILRFSREILFRKKKKKSNKTVKLLH